MLLLCADVFHALHSQPQCGQNARAARRLYHADCFCDALAVLLRFLHRHSPIRYTVKRDYTNLVLRPQIIQTANCGFLCHFHTRHTIIAVRHAPRMVNHKSHAQIRRFALRFQFHFHRQDFFQRRAFIAAKREGILSPADNKPAARCADIAFQYCQKALWQVGNRRIRQHNRTVFPQSFHRDGRGLRRQADNLRMAAFQQFPPFNSIIFRPQ